MLAFEGGSAARATDVRDVGAGTAEVPSEDLGRPIRGDCGAAGGRLNCFSMTLRTLSGRSEPSLLQKTESPKSLYALCNREMAAFRIDESWLVTNSATTCSALRGTTPSTPPFLTDKATSSSMHDDLTRLFFDTIIPSNKNLPTREGDQASAESFRSSRARVLRGALLWPNCYAT